MHGEGMDELRNLKVPKPGKWLEEEQKRHPELGLHLDFNKSGSREREYDPEAAKRYLDELRERMKIDREGTRDDVQKIITQLEQMLNDTIH